MKPQPLPMCDDRHQLGSEEGESAFGKSQATPIAAAGVVHDLGNLIQIASAAINIVERTSGMPAAHIAPMLHRARICLEHAGAIVRQNVGHLRHRAIAVPHSDAAKCLTDVAALVEAMDEPGLFLELEIEPAMPAIRCDPVGLRRAVLNLVLNARDAMGSNGIVAVEAKALAHGEVELRVLDDGVGMSRATIERVFDPFFTTKSDGLGGIGLPMVDSFVRDSGGTMRIDSEPGIGTTVTLRLPAVTAPIGTDEPAPFQPLAEGQSQ